MRYHWFKFARNKVHCLIMYSEEVVATKPWQRRTSFTNDCANWQLWHMLKKMSTINLYYLMCVLFSMLDIEPRWRRCIWTCIVSGLYEVITLYIKVITFFYDNVFFRSDTSGFPLTRSISSLFPLYKLYESCIKRVISLHPSRLQLAAYEYYLE